MNGGCRNENGNGEENRDRELGFHVPPSSQMHREPPQAQGGRTFSMRLYRGACQQAALSPN
jgi:hypothetical protein